ncbi:MAG TPA: TonB-dependent receptor [Gammaproteobacteria bacterium]|nr:TonB-dependent receptor [Gammaproteobacteria bacterium]
METRSLSLSKIVRGLLLTGAVGALQIAPALAQEPATDETPPPPGSAQLGKIEVTGTRIKRADVEAARPITIVTQEQIKATGLTSLGDVLQQLPSTGAAANRQFNNGGSGRTNIDLRNLGANRVLVLLDGKRVVSGLGGDVDLNTVPVAVVDHVEILQDGASSLYGSDAISGVINIITLKRYNGAEANAHFGKYDAHADGGGWDGQEEQYDFTLGSSGDRGGAVMNVSYVNEAPIFAGDRTISKEPVVGSHGGSFLTPSGLFNIFDAHGCPGSATPNSYGTCSMTLVNTPKPGRAGTPNGPSLGNFRNIGNGDRFNYAPANFLAIPSERSAFYLEGHYDIADNLSFSTQALFNERKSSQQLAPNTLTLGAFGQAKANGVPLGISAQNPYNPFGVDLVANFSDACIFAGSCDSLLFLGRRLSEGGNRVFTQTVKNFQFNGGFEGYYRLLGNEWDWDAGFAYGNNNESDQAGGVVNTFRLQQELGVPGAAPCAGAGAGCIPLNIFGGGGTITPAMLGYVLFEQHDVVTQNMRNYTANTSGTLMDLPAGPLGMALGAEYLETDGFSHPDALVTQGNTANSLIPPTEGRETTRSEYVEFDIPLAAGMPFMQKVDLDLANRWSHFEWKGGALNTGNAAAHTDSASTGSASLRWQSNDQLLLRASWTQGFRIPSISDLFLADSDSFQFLTDPCVVTPANPVKAPKCGAGPYSLQFPGSGEIHTTIGGNTNLTPERAISQTVGFVYDPDWLPGFDVSADYYKINLQNAISQIPAQLVLDGCYVDGQPRYCSLITRSGGDHSANAPGAITNIDNLNINASGIKVEGMDLSLHYKFPSTAVGDFKAGVEWAFTKQYVATLAFGNDFSSQELSGTTTNGAGTAGTSSVTGGIPKQRGTLNLNWSRGDWSATWNVQYVGALVEDCSAAATVNPPSRCPLTVDFPFESGPVPGNHIGATVYHDAQLTYHVDALHSDFGVGVRNLFDKQPPIAMSAFANSFLPTFYRTPGRFLYVTVGVKL